MNSVTTCRPCVPPWTNSRTRICALSWGESKAVESLELAGARGRIRATVGYPSGGYAHELAQLLTKHLAAAPGGPGGGLGVDLQLRSRHPAACRTARPHAIAQYR